VKHMKKLNKKKSIQKSEKMENNRLAIEEDEINTEKTLNKYGVSKKRVLFALLLSLFVDMLGYSMILTIMAAAIFVWPLWGIHTLIERQKEEALDEINLRSLDLFTKLNQSIDENDYDATDRLNGTIASLEIQHKRISEVPTWPWRSETARVALTAIALPLMLMILQFFLQHQSCLFFLRSSGLAWTNGVYDLLNKPKHELFVPRIQYHLYHPLQIYLSTKPLICGIYLLKSLEIHDPRLPMGSTHRNSE